MSRLLSGYAASYNRRHQRHGHLFQNRYKSSVCEEDPFFMELVRYIHLNPLRAKLVQNFAKFGRYSFPPMSVCNALLRILKKYAIRKMLVSRRWSGSRRQKVVLVRSQLTKTLVEEWGFSLTETGRHLGVTASAIAKILYRLDKHIPRKVINCAFFGEQWASRARREGAK